MESELSTPMMNLLVAPPVLKAIKGSLIVEEALMVNWVLEVENSSSKLSGLVVPTPTLPEDDT